MDFAGRARTDIATLKDLARAFDRLALAVLPKGMIETHQLVDEVLETIDRLDEAPFAMLLTPLAEYAFILVRETGDPASARKLHELATIATIQVVTSMIPDLEKRASASAA